MAVPNFKVVPHFKNFKSGNQADKEKAETSKLDADNLTTLHISNDSSRKLLLLAPVKFRTPGHRFFLRQHKKIEIKGIQV